MRKIKRVLGCKRDGTSILVEMTNGYFYYYEKGLVGVLVVHDPLVVIRNEPQVLESDGYDVDLTKLEFLTDQIYTLPAVISPVSERHIKEDESEL
ncbi:MAG: hypothetical protein Q4D21_08335 [Phascolarctobacterium sp.]|nr:hypothetical protein [Phascolarctobacterium sp.]